jgi:hypothetical protein
MSSGTALLFAAFVIPLVFINELAPRMMAMRDDPEFKTYALKRLRPWVYAMSFSVYCGVTIGGQASTALLVATMVVLAGYVVAKRVHTDLTRGILP